MSSSYARLLEVKGLKKRFGGQVVLDDVTFSLDRGEILGLIGPNGSGKTTLLNLILGFIRADDGDILLEEKKINGLAPYEIAKRGIGRVFQAPSKLFPRLTVMENMAVAGLSCTRNREDVLVDKAKSLLGRFNLNGLADEKASNLSGGQQRLLEFARALMLEPKILLLDEPTAGVHPDLIELIHASIRENSRRGLAIVYVSHDIQFVLELCTKIMVLSEGKKIAEDVPEKIVTYSDVIEAYLGS